MKKIIIFYIAVLAAIAQAQADNIVMKGDKGKELTIIMGIGSIIFPEIKNGKE